jgi:HSP90 family molecular chaperone
MSIQAIRAKRDEAVAQEQHILTRLVKALNVALDNYEADKSQVSIIGNFFKNGLTVHRQRAIDELRAILKESEILIQYKTAPLDAYTLRKNFAARLKQEDLSVFGLSGLADRVWLVLQNPEFSYHALHQLRETSHQASLAYEKYRQLQRTSTVQTAIEEHYENELLKDQQNHIDLLSVLHTVSSLTTETTQNELEQERQKNQQLGSRVERIEGLLNTIIEQNSQLQLSVSNLQDENKLLKAEKASYRRQLLEQGHSAYPGVLWPRPQASINTADSYYDLPLAFSQYAVHNEI